MRRAFALVTPRFFVFASSLPQGSVTTTLCVQYVSGSLVVDARGMRAALAAALAGACGALSAEICEHTIKSSKELLAKFEDTGRSIAPRPTSARPTYPPNPAPPPLPFPAHSALRRARVGRARGELGGSPCCEGDSRAPAAPA